MSFLRKILETKKEEVSILRKCFSINSFKESEYFSMPSISLKKALCRGDRLGIISEIKKASPSKGILKEKFDHLAIAKEYIDNETDAISILTDKNYFNGDIKYLNNIAAIKTIPLLRKDFIIDEFQILEAKANGADAILLIAEALSKTQITELTAAAKECGLEVLLEIHSSAQLEKINFEKNDLIGINNRNLETFEVNLNTTSELAAIIPGNVTLVSESGLNTIDDLNRIKSSRAKAVLVGEHFMRSGNIGESFKEFKRWCLLK